MNELKLGFLLGKIRQKTLSCADFSRENDIDEAMVETLDSIIDSIDFFISEQGKSNE